MELALVLAPTGRALEAIHVWSEDNELADRLSRLTDHTVANIPPELCEVTRTVWPDALQWRIIRDTL